MFSVYNRDLPEVEKCILDKLGQRDLLHSKQVCKSWANAVRRYIGRLSAGRISDLMRSALLERVPTYGVIDLQQPVRDLAINESKQGGNSIGLKCGPFPAHFVKKIFDYLIIRLYHIHM